MHLIAAHCSLQLVIMLRIFPMIEVGEKTTKHWLGNLPSLWHCAVSTKESLRETKEKM